MKKILLLAFISHFIVLSIYSQNKKGIEVKNKDITKFFALLIQPGRGKTLSSTVMKSLNFDENTMGEIDIKSSGQFMVDSLTWVKSIQILEDKNSINTKYIFKTIKKRSKLSSKRINYKKYIQIIHGYIDIKAHKYIFIQFVTPKEFEYRGQMFYYGYFFKEPPFRYALIRLPS